MILVRFKAVGYLVALVLTILGKYAIAKPLMKSDSDQAYEVRYRYERELNTTQEVEVTTKVVVEVDTILAGVRTETTTFGTVQDIRGGDVKVDTPLPTNATAPKNTISAKINVDTTLDEFRVNTASPTRIIIGKTSSEDSALEQVNMNTAPSTETIVNTTLSKNTTSLEIDVDTTESDKTQPNTTPSNDLTSAQLNVKSTVTEVTVNTDELSPPKVNTSTRANENIAKSVETSTDTNPPKNRVEEQLNMDTTASVQSIIETTPSQDTTLAQVIMDASLIKNKVNVTPVKVTIDTAQTKIDLDTAESIVTDTTLSDRKITIKSSSTTDEGLSEIQTTAIPIGVIKNSSNVTYMNITTGEIRSEVIAAIIKINPNVNSDNENVSDIVINMTTSATEVRTDTIMNTSLLETLTNNAQTKITTTTKPAGSWISTTSAIDVSPSASVDSITDKKPTGTLMITKILRSTTPTETLAATSPTRTSSSVGVTDTFTDKISTNSENMKDGKERQTPLNTDITNETEIGNSSLKTRSIISEGTLTITYSEVTDVPKSTTKAKKYRDLSINETRNNNSFVQSVQNTNETTDSASPGDGKDPGFSTTLSSTLTNDITDKIFQSLMDRIQQHWAEFINKMKQSVIEAWQTISSTMLSSLQTLEV
ncbi:cell wall protein RTB1-like [Limulus polyphemus]|uniref:Cell wall protein RTB1-like n=1 Tax=Limulus polyphemus TaxID=6850 RepID=A0ABM1BA90_LIMPO|nr:cell wall protein RTB1-like [Limulus polyphemus]